MEVAEGTFPVDRVLGNTVVIVHPEKIVERASRDRVSLAPTPASLEELTARVRPWTDAELVPASYPFGSAVDRQNFFAPLHGSETDKQVDPEVPPPRPFKRGARTNSNMKEAVPSHSDVKIRSGDLPRPSLLDVRGTTPRNGVYGRWENPSSVTRTLAVTLSRELRVSQQQSTRGRTYHDAKRTSYSGIGCPTPTLDEQVC